jgi:hypothetical protein
LTRNWRKFHNEEFHNLYSSRNFIRVIKWVRMRWVGYMACMAEKRNACKIVVGKPGKGIPVLFFFVTEHHAMKAYSGVEA